MIRFEQVGKRYPNGHVGLHELSFRVRRGEFLFVTGHSGAGKSTLLRLINRLEEPSGGKIIVDGEDVTAFNANQLRGFRQQVGMIFQHFNLLASKTVADNVALPLTLAGELSGSEIDQRVAELLARVGLSDHAKKYPAQLSGGQKQRVSIARAIAKEPKILILDDCLSAVDTKTENSILTALRKIMENRTSVIISHRVSSAKLADHIIVLDDGKIIERGDHDSLMRQKGVYADLFDKQTQSGETVEG